MLAFVTLSILAFAGNGDGDLTATADVGTVSSDEGVYCTTLSHHMPYRVEGFLFSGDWDTT